MRHGGRRLTIALLVLIGVGGAQTVPQAAAAVLYSNLGPGDSFSSDHAWLVGGPSLDQGSTTIGVQFVPMSTGRVSSIDVAFYHDEGGAKTDVFFELRADDGSDFPELAGSPLDEMTLAGTRLNETATLYNILSTNHPVLIAGTPYWLIASTGGKGLLGWNQTEPIVIGNLYTHLFDIDPPVDSTTVNREILATLRVNAAIVPEPSTLWLGSIALLCGGAAGCRRRG